MIALVRIKGATRQRGLELRLRDLGKICGSGPRLFLQFHPKFAPKRAPARSRRPLRASVSPEVRRDGRARRGRRLRYCGGGGDGRARASRSPAARAGASASPTAAAARGGCLRRLWRGYLGRLGQVPHRIRPPRVLRLPEALQGELEPAARPLPSAASP